MERGNDFYFLLCFQGALTLFETMRERSTLLWNACPSLLLVLLLTQTVAPPLQAQSRTRAFANTNLSVFDLATALLPAAPCETPLGTTSLKGPYTPTALPCSINVACSEGDDWLDETNAVVKISNGCTGVLINNTREDEMPYVLTVHHCGQPSVGETVDWVFAFNYQSPTCANPTEEPEPQTIEGATVVAARPGPDDFVLLQLSEEIPASFGVTHAGWSIENTLPSSGVLISHPKQDLKKITIDDDPLTDVAAYWVAAFDHGTVEVGSSGAPLFNEQHQVIGLVRGALNIDYEACSGPDGDDNRATILFPKISAIWNLGAPGERLSDFLDPDNTGATTLPPLSGTGGQLLPVELVSFEAMLDGNTVELHWQTASETNNAGFEIQSRISNLEFQNFDWDVLAFVEGYGTTERPQAYHYRIENLEPGRHFFRLKQIDFDGTFEYHPEVEVIVEMVERFIVEPVYPNPFNPLAQFRFAVQRSQQVRVDLYDVLGRQVRVLYEGTPQAGQMHTVPIDGSDLPSGMYLVRVAGQSFVKTQTVTLLK